MAVELKGRKITWYRSPIAREDLALLNRRSNFLGFLQTFGHLGLLVLSGGCAWYAAYNLPLPFLFLALFIHGTFFAFLLNGFHEFCHRTVFKSDFLNEFFLRLFSLIGMYNHVHFWASHQEHHKYTLHPPDDLEVVLPTFLNVRSFLKAAIVNPLGYYNRIRGIIRIARGRLQGEWENALFPDTDPARRGRLIRWARILLVVHTLLAAVSIYSGYWMIPVLITLAPAYGGWLLFLCNNTQHIGLSDNVPDFRLCTRTVLLNPFVQFLYWHMNYHIEHHMYAAVPCYRLGKLHRLIQQDLPYCPDGLVDAWRGIADILREQKADPEYQFTPELPAQAAG